MEDIKALIREIIKDEIKEIMAQVKKELKECVKKEGDKIKKTKTKVVHHYTDSGSCAN